MEGDDRSLGAEPPVKFKAEPLVGRVRGQSLPNVELFFILDSQFCVAILCVNVLNTREGSRIAATRAGLTIREAHTNARRGPLPSPFFSSLFPSPFPIRFSPSLPLEVGPLSPARRSAGARAL